MVRLRDIWQKLYPYGIFCVDTGLSAEGGLSAQRSFIFQRKRSGNKVAYLTFDDGPIPEVTPKVLDILAKYGVKATFFMVGENIDKHPEVFAQVIAAGHAVGNHTYNHLKGWNHSFEQYMANVEKTQKTIAQHLPKDYPAPVLNRFRPPYGKATFAQRRALSRQGYKLIYWDILTRDYDASVTTQQMVSKIKRQVRPGSIINFHDSLKSNERMLQALPQVIEWLQSKGYKLEKLEIDD